MSPSPFSRFRYGFVAACGFALAAITLFVIAPPASAAEAESVEARLAQIEEKLAENESNSAVQELFLKISRLEQALRDITGLAEDAERASRQLNNRFEKFATDAQDRLDLIEEKLREGVASAPADDSENNPATLDDAEALYDYALNRFLVKKDFPTAAKSFESFLDRFPDHPKSDRIHYWLGELYFEQKDYRKAAQYYLDGYRSFAQGEKAMDNLFKLGLSLAALGQAQESCSVFGELDDNFPNAPARITRLVERERRQIPCV